MTANERLVRLARLTNRGTYYELAAILGDQRRLVAYTQRRSRSGMLAACRNRAVLLIALTGAENLQFGKRTVDGATMGDWQIRFTGRTERDAIMEGELPYIGAAQVAEVAA